MTRDLSTYTDAALKDRLRILTAFGTWYTMSEEIRQVKRELARRKVAV